MRTLRHVMAAVFVCLCALPVMSAGEPMRAAYIHIDQCFDQSASIAEREQSIRHTVNEIKEAGLQTIVPYASNTSGQTNYPSQVVRDHRWKDWDPIAVFVDEAHNCGLNVHLCIPVLTSGHKKPTGILKHHPEWALLGKDGQPIGSISPGHPQARDWIVRWLEEVVERYSPDGLLLDYLRFPSQVSQLDAVSAIRFAAWESTITDEASRLQIFRELLLTELMGMISDRLRASRPDLHLAIYSWGHHVTSGHRVAQNWPEWARRDYIDEVNVCGYWYPATYPKRWGATHLEAFEKVLTESQRLLREAEADTKLTFALGVRTSHGQVCTIVDIASYLQTAARLNADGTTFFTWSYLIPFLPQLKATGVLQDYAAGRPIEDLTTANIRKGEAPGIRVADGNRSETKTSTLLVATADSSQQAKDNADFTGDGQGDQQEINAAIAALPAVGGTVELAEGTYDIRKEEGALGGVLIERSNIVLAGRGAATKLILAPGQNTNVIRIIGSGVHHVTIRDLAVDANREQNNEGRGDPNISHDRFEFCGIKGYCRDPRGPGAKDLSHITVRNCEVRNAHRLGIMLEGSILHVLGNVLGNAGSDVVELLTGPGMIRGNYVEITGQTHVAIGSDRGNSIQMSDNIVHVKANGKLDIGFRSWTDSLRHVIHGNVLIVDQGGRCGLAMDLRGQMQTVTGNTIENQNSDGEMRLRIGGGNTILSDNILKNVIVEVNDTYEDSKPIHLQNNLLDQSFVKILNGHVAD